ncbi:allantoicase [Actinokineospora sp. UTMC 2448]|uniref:allantoicase n=1 Tax=Actinokineospora sp. UTMC 2448 TaxID=2268449 RepID=UPI002164A0E5|nr:allantoicase [Actinokineospora sp. UTMC 2448]UVS81144.1 allantoicase [Actinokineospora sp. UTMC 2448]
MTDWLALPDLAVRRFGGSVVWADDETFAEKENLITTAPPGYQPHTFGHRGQIYDGWETRRRRVHGDDSAVIRLGMPGVIRGVVVDTSFFTGNYPPACSVAACAASGYPDPAELGPWEPLLTRVPLTGDSRTEFEVDNPRRFTHVRLTMHPDGGIARLRVHGHPVPDPALLDPAALDLAALENGARVIACSDMFYSSPSNLIAPGMAVSMGEGWETRRRRDHGNDWAVVRLAAEGVIRFAELDTTHFKGNAPGWAALSAGHPEESDSADWAHLLPRTRLQPDTRHRFRITDAVPATHVRLDIYPDGGMARLRLFGSLTPAGLDLIETFRGA